MQLLHFLSLISLSISGAVASPGYYTSPTPVTSPPSAYCSTSTYYSTICSTPSAAWPTAPANNNNQQNICKSGSPFCCALSSYNGNGNTNDNSHSCNQMDNSTINCDSTVVCCNNNGGGTQICTNDLTIIIPIDLSDILGDDS